MKQLFRSLPILLALLLVANNAVAQRRAKPYFTKEVMPDLVKCLPAPPDTSDLAFQYDVLRYRWGKEMRKDPVRAAQASRDAIWDLDTLAAIFSEPFGRKISWEDTPEIYEALTRGVASIELIRIAPKAHYFRIRPFVHFQEPSLFPQDDEALSHEGSYPSGHTIRGWAAALILAEINPAAANELFARAWIYGENRVIVGAHWQSDVDVSRAGASVGYSFLQSYPEYREQVKKAQAELAGLPLYKSSCCCK